MRHQDRQVHVAQDVARDAAYDQLPQPGVTIGAHHQRVAVQFAAHVQDDFADAGVVVVDVRPQLDIYTMLRQEIADLLAGRIGRARPLDAQDGNGCRVA